MKLNLQDKSNYLKGLLVLVSKDNKISEQESSFILNVGKILGFNREFCEEAINTLLENKYISQAPPKFSKKAFAESFVLDGLKLVVSDEYLHKNEISYLKSTAEENGIDDGWFDTKFDSAEDELNQLLVDESPSLELTKYL